MLGVSRVGTAQVKGLSSEKLSEHSMLFVLLVFISSLQLIVKLSRLIKGVTFSFLFQQYLVTHLEP